jgi:septum formation protein maf
MKEKKYRIVLGSQSARRQQLLKGLDIDFEIKTLDNTEETFPSDMPAGEVAPYLARRKAEALQPLADDELLITADTVVVVDGKIYGKPSGKEEARSMLQTLSGRMHEVITGVAITTAERSVVFAVSTKVWFTHISTEDIDYYIERYRPFDKAGSYGIQEWIGFVGIEHIEGSFYNVMGLPVHRIYRVLKDFGAI